MPAHDPIPSLDYVRVDYGEPHVSRGRELLAAHPELRALAGPQPSSGLWVAALVAAQFAVALLVGDWPWYFWLPTAYLVGATIDHALWVLIHESSHNLIFRTRLMNRVAALVANTPMVVPAAMSFCKYHLLHHRHMGELALDADLAGPGEAAVVGRSSAAKVIWLGAQALVLGVVRPRRLKSIPVVDRWTLTNLVVQILVVSALVAWTGVGPLKYLLVSTVLAVGLHPLGARWIQEHYVFAEGQETYSYYGPLNRLAFNVGYHNEHHDLTTIPWSRLPIVRQTAPEFYDDLHAHHSWTRLLVTFLGRRDTTLFSRVVRPDGTSAGERRKGPVRTAQA